MYGHSMAQEVGGVAKPIVDFRCVAYPGNEQEDSLLRLNLHCTFEEVQNHNLQEDRMPVVKPVVQNTYKLCRSRGASGATFQCMQFTI